MIRYVAVRGTSQLEGYHKHLIDLFVGANYSAALAGALVTMFNFRCGAVVAWTADQLARAVDCVELTIAMTATLTSLFCELAWHCVDPRTPTTAYPPPWVVCLQVLSAQRHPQPR